jgi:hypothetical protein
MPNRFNYRCPKCGSTDDVVIDANVSVWLNSKVPLVIETKTPPTWHSTDTIGCYAAVILWQAALAANPKKDDLAQPPSPAKKPVRAMPNPVLRSAIFSAIQSKDRRFLDNQLTPTVDGISKSASLASNLISGRPRSLRRGVSPCPNSSPR